MATRTKKYTSNIPLTSDAREKFVEELFQGEMPHQGELFLPNDEFYKGDNPQSQAENMIELLGKWLGIKPGYLGLEFQDVEIKKLRSRNYNIFIDQSLLSDEFALGAKIAFALTRYLVEERKQILSSQIDQQTGLLAYASVEFGLGVVITNGFKPGQFFKKMGLNYNNDILNGYSQFAYSQELVKYTRKYRIDQNNYINYLAPWAAEILGLKLSKNPSHAVRDAIHQVRISKFKFAGVIWILILIILSGVFVIAQKVKPLDKNISQAQQKILLLNDQVKECVSRLNYDKQFTDSSDILAIKTINASELKCKSLQNDQNNAENAYADLLKK